MEWLNYHHLLYFWVVAREGGLGPAGKVLRLARPTLSAQIKALEDQLGHPLFAREGRRLVLTDFGTVTFRYADEIFGIGRELLAVARSGSVGSTQQLTVGVSDGLPKMVVRRVLEPVWTLDPPVHLVCVEDSHEQLLARLAAHELDAILTDAPVPNGSPVRAFGHLLGESGITFFGAGPLAKLKAHFPRSLDGAPLLLPTRGTALRRALEEWFREQGITPRIVAEFEDSALLKSIAQQGVGVFAAPSAVEKDVAAQYEAKALGRVPQIRERFYVLSAERRLRHPAVAALTASARTSLFAEPAGSDPG